MQMTEDIQYALGRMESKLDHLMKNQDEALARHKDIETRLTKLEQWRHTLLGGAAVVGFLASRLADYLLK